MDPVITRLRTLQDVLQDADTRRVAVGHFNISELAALNGIFAAARELNLPVLIGVSEGEREFIGTRTAAAIIRNLREEFNFPIFLDADHTHSIEKVKEAAEAGFDEIVFDGSALPWNENIRLTAEAVKTVRSINPRIVVEGEIGYIGPSSEIVSERPAESLKFSTPDEAVKFVKKTGIDVLAPAVGNMHGLMEKMITGEEHKRLNIDLIGEIKKACGKFMTLHGGSGTADEDFVAAARAGITIIHVSSELRLAWRRGIEEGLAKNPKEIAPYKILPPAVEKIKGIVLNRMRLYNQGVSS
jgi:ketose-bisphosphate aldolase